MSDWIADIRERNQAWLDHDIEDTWSYIDRAELLKLLERLYALPKYGIKLSRIDGETTFSLHEQYFGNYALWSDILAMLGQKT